MRALIIGAENQKVDRLKCHLAGYFSEIDLLTDPGQLCSPTAVSPAIIVVTDTLAGVLNQYFVRILRSVHPGARLLCLVDRISRESERALRAAGLLFLGSYEHFGACHTSILKSAVAKGDPSKNQSSTISALTSKRLDISLKTENRK